MGKQVYECASAPRRGALDRARILKTQGGADVAHTIEHRWAAWWATYPGPDKQSEAFSWWSRRPASYDSAKWYASLDDDERDRLQEAIRHHRGPLSTGTGSAPHKAG